MNHTIVSATDTENIFNIREQTLTWAVVTSFKHNICFNQDLHVNKSIWSQLMIDRSISWLVLGHPSAGMLLCGHQNERNLLVSSPQQGEHSLGEL